MARKVLLTPTPWHPGYPFRPRGGKLRRAASMLTLATLATVIGGYWYVTDSKRVKAVAEKQLTELIGGPVHIGRARLSIFEGLRLDNVTISVDKNKLPDSELLRAESLQVSFPLDRILAGEFSEVTILAVEPKVLLVSDAEGDAWNFQRLKPKSTTRTADEKSQLSLPQVLLRNARVTYAEMHEGKLLPRGSVTVEGSLIPDVGRSDQYSFAVTARGQSNRPGPSLTGWTKITTGQISARLRNFDLGPDFEGMLPGPVRTWWQRHEIAGSVEIPELSIEPASPDHPRTFRVLTRFEGGAMAFRPDELHLPDAPAIPEGLPSIKFNNVQGELLFTEAGIELREMSLVHEGNTLKVNGSLAGYNSDAAFSISAACDNLTLPENPTFLPSIPPEVKHDIFDQFKPSGQGSFAFKIDRNKEGKLIINGRLDIAKGQMTFEGFPFTCHDLTGAIVATSVAPNQTRLDVINIKGHGKAGTANDKADLIVNGTMFPLEGGSEVDFHISGENVIADEPLVAAMPKGVQEALQMFAGDPARKFPQFDGSFKVLVHRDPGPISHWLWPIDVKIAHGKGKFEPFPYPLENLSGEVGIRSGYVLLNNMRMSRSTSSSPNTPPATLALGGKITYRDQPEDKLLYDLKLEAGHVPVDQTLLAAIPEDKREWISNLGVSGLLSVQGNVTGLDGHYDLGLTLTEGKLNPFKSEWVATDVTGNFRITPSSFTIEKADASRLGSPIHAEGKIAWGNSTKSATTTVASTTQPSALEITLSTTAKNLPFDTALRSILPDDAKSGWDAVKPEGNADLKISLLPNTPTAIDITPLGATVTPSLLPVTLTNLQGHIAIANGAVKLENLTATRNQSPIQLSGTGSTSPRGTWDITLDAQKIDLDKPLQAALPDMLKETFAALDATGKADVQIRQLKFTPGEDRPAPAASATTAATQPKIPGTGANADFDISILPLGMGISVGVPLHASSGAISVKGAIRDDRLGAMTGDINIKTGDIGGRAYTNLRATITKSADQPGLRLDNIGGKIADGDLDGRAAIAFPDNQPVRYAMELKLHNADVPRLTGSKGADVVSGRLSASLALEGAADDPANRKGRGDIAVTGDHMARIPVLLGLVQLANLSLPTNTSFNNATASYTIDGARVNFEQLLIRSPGFQMEGSGHIDLDQRDVRLTFRTNPSPDLPRIPVWTDLTDRVRRELLQFTVRGTIDDPKIGARSFDSFTTTVEEVFDPKNRAPVIPAPPKK